MAHVILYSNLNLQGDHRHIVADEPNLVGANFNDQTQSFVIVEGTWQFFKDVDFRNPFTGYFGPGAYTNADIQGVIGHSLSSLRPTTHVATVHGDAVPAIVTLFEHQKFRGDHRHVFFENPDFTAANFPPFNDKASSIVIQRRGAVRSVDALFCSDIHYQRPYSAVFQSGIYSTLTAFGLPDNDLSSLKFVNGLPSQIPQGYTLQVGDMAFGDLILFEHEDFRGRHRHVYQEESDLGIADDPQFSGIASSMWIGFGAWSFYSEANFQNLMPTWFPTTSEGALPSPRKFFTPGAYRSFTQIGLRNDALKSLRLLMAELHAPPDELGRPTASSWVIAFVGLHEAADLHISFSGNDITSSMQLYQTITDANGYPWGYAYFKHFESDRGIPQTFNITCPIEGPFIASTKTSSLNWIAPVIPVLTTPKVTVPNIVGLHKDVAIRVLQAAHLDMGNEYNFTAVTDPTMLIIIGQQPEAGRLADKGSLVNVGEDAVSSPEGKNLVHCINLDANTVHVWMSDRNAWKDLGAIISGGSMDVNTPENQTVQLEAFLTGISPENSTHSLVSTTVSPNTGPHQLIIP